MIRHSMKLAGCVGVFAAVVLTNNAMALNKVQCEQLPGNMFLAAIERGDCDINIQTAAGPQEDVVIPEDGGNRSRDGRNGGDGGNDGGDGGRGGASPGGPAHR